VRAQRLRELRRHATETTQAGHRELVTGFEAVVLDGGPNSDAGAKEGRGGGEVQVCRDGANEALVHDNVLSVGGVRRRLRKMT